MTTLYQTRLKCLEKPANRRLLAGIRHGIEREGLRVTRNAELSQRAHPQALGKALTHPYITTDFSEALLEYITPVYSEITDALSFLQELHTYSADHLDNELLWAGSMPCRLPSHPLIPVARYGTSNIGQIKSVYREGLSHRYGKAMQTIAGLHYNLSLPEDFWHLLNSSASKGYMALIRNFRRYSWLLMYLFGASPTVDSSFFAPGQHPDGLENLGQDTLFQPYATSLRMSDMGYTNNAQSSLNICYNTLAQYIDSLSQAMATPYPPYREIGLVSPQGQFRQLNVNLLQIENEYYSTIRPKRIARSREKPLTALRQGGIEYVEVRCMDINPFEPLGIQRQDADFLDIFLLYCALHDSPPIAAQECHYVSSNFDRVVQEGRRPNLQLDTLDGQLSLTDWGLGLLDRMQPLAALMDELTGSTRYSRSFAQQQARLENSALTPSAQVLAALTDRGLSHNGFMLGQSEQHQALFQQQPLGPERVRYFQQLAEQSRQDQSAIEQADSTRFECFLQQYLQAN